MLELYAAPLSHYRMLDVYHVSWLMPMLRCIPDWLMLIGYMMLICERNYCIWWRQWGLRGSAWLWYHIKHVIRLCCVQETSVCQPNENIIHWDLFKITNLVIVFNGLICCQLACLCAKLCACPCVFVGTLTESFLAVWFWGVKWNRV